LQQTKQNKHGTPLAEVFLFPGNGARKCLDCYRWRGGDEVNDRPVAKPQEEGMMNIAASFSLNKKPRFVDPVGKSQYS
jgi:hypothetical protein